MLGLIEDALKAAFLKAESEISQSFGSSKSFSVVSFVYWRSSVRRWRVKEGAGYLVDGREDRSKFGCGSNEQPFLGDMDLPCRSGRTATVQRPVLPNTSLCFDNLQYKGYANSFLSYVLIILPF